MMKHLLSGVALAALLTAGLPVMAQTGSGSTKQPAAAQTGATTSAGSMDKSSNSAKSGGKHGASASDHMAAQLNKQELQRLQNGDQPMTGTSQPPAATPSAGSTKGAR
jgi:hypothetical protein